MEWYHYFSGFWAGAFFANFIPHFVNGICGNRFPSPFNRPIGKALSSPTLNVVWGLINLIIGYTLFKVGKVTDQDYLSIGIFFVGFAALGLRLSVRFSHKDKE